MSEEEEHSESEFYYPDKLEFQDNIDLTDTNNKRVGEKEKRTHLGVFPKTHLKLCFVLVPKFHTLSGVFLQKGLFCHTSWCVTKHTFSCVLRTHLTIHLKP